jgi:hypothetical protein
MLNDLFVYMEVKAMGRVMSLLHQLEIQCCPVCSCNIILILFQFCTSELQYFQYVDLTCQYIFHA